MKSIASHNGLAGTQLVYDRLGEKTALLDALTEGIALIEDDPEELTVGYGGLPNEEGVVELDAAIMDGASHRGAAVAALRSVRNPTKVAQRLLEQTDRVLLVGEGALKFAKANGFVEENLLTDKARRMWLYWRQMRSDGHDDWRSPERKDLELDLQHWFDTNFYRPTGTVHVSALNQTGSMACATSTSGHAFKLPGRVGDSPILGAGLYVDNKVGSCGSIGHGEANQQHCSSFLAVELMRGGLSPREAGLEVLRRITEKVDAHKLDDSGAPPFNLQLFLLAADGTHAGVALRGGKQIAVTDAEGSRLEPCTALFEGHAKGA